MKKPAAPRSVACSSRTFSHKLCPRDAFSNLVFVPEMGVRHERAVQPWPEVVEALGVVLAQIQELWQELVSCTPILVVC